MVDGIAIMRIFDPHEKYRKCDCEELERETSAECADHKSLTKALVYALRQGNGLLEYETSRCIVKLPLWNSNQISKAFDRRLE